MLRTFRRPLRVRPAFVLSSPLSVRRQELASSSPTEPTTPPPSSSSPPEEDASKHQHQIRHAQTCNLKSSESSSPTYSPLSSSLQMPSQADLDAMKQRLREWAVQNASALRVRMDDFSEATRVAFAQLGGRLNEVTGYHEIEVLKKLVVENERKMHEIREAARAAKAAYEDAVARRSGSQREVNDLLQRKSSWSDADVLRFTQLVRADHMHEHDEARAQAAVTDADTAAERQFGELMRAILARYHEEQVWSDKIRSASTYGSLAALGLNLLVFVLAIVLVEPWKRRRLVQSFERRVVELSEANQRVVEDGLGELRAHQEAQDRVLAEIRAAQAELAQAAITPAVVALEEDTSEKVKEVSAAPSIDIERSAKAARDRQLYVLSAAGALGAGIIGFVMGSWCS